MSSALASTLARCAVRRARPVLAANPLVAAAAALLAVTTPPLAVLAGERLGAALGPVVAEEEGVAAALVLGLALTAAAAGALTALAAPGAAALGSQLRAAPIRRLEAFVWLTLAPLALAAAAASAVAACVLVPVAAATPGGAAAAAPLLVGGLAAGALGAAAAEGALGAVRGSVAGAIAVTGAAAVWAIGALAAGDPPTGPLGPAAEALRGRGESAAAALWAGATGVAAGGLWALATVHLPEERHSRARVRAVLPIAGGPYVASALAAVKQLGRRRELRRAVGATTALAVGGAALLARGLVGAPEAAFVLAGAAALLGCAAVPVASYGVEREGAWLTDSSPVPRGRRASAAALATLALALGLLTLSLAGVRLVAPASPQQFAALVAAGCVLFGAALASGTLLPWRADGALDQLAAFAALGALALLLWLGLGELVVRTTGAGVPRPLATGVALAVPPLLGVGAGAVAARRRRP